MVATIVEELESGDTTDLLALRIGTLSLALSQRTWDMTIAVVLQSISVELPQVNISFRLWILVAE